ncbi:MFS transporter [Pseudorhodoplanes sp.]|uniref:MFS transporter n=1 Tax=Pseudorhodoplanes sp. TaxID=1934341 RepID=UPI00391DAC06
MDGLAGSRPSLVDTSYAWLRLGVALVLGTIGSVGMWSYVVALPSVQADFAATRADASLPYTLAMAGFAVGNLILGRLADRFGILVPIWLSIASLGIGYVSAGFAPTLWLLCAAHLLIGFGSAASFGPLIADLSHWFEKRRGIAIAIAASGNYVAGAVWPPVAQHFIASDGWRATHIGIGIFCVIAMLPLSLMFRRRSDFHTNGGAQLRGFVPPNIGVSQNTLFVLLCIAGIGCCVAMAMPQVHIVAYCGDLGYGVARGAEMLSLMLAFGIVSRVGSGFIADRFGGVVTLLIGSVMQAVALFLYFLFDGLTSLYIISILFGLFQGGIVPSYAVIVREYFPPQEAGARVGMVIMATVFGMALGGWMSGWIFDLTGSYRAAFLNGLAWNLLNLAIALWLLRAGRPGARMAVT